MEQVKFESIEDFIIFSILCKNGKNKEDAYNEKVYYYRFPFIKTPQDLVNFLTEENYLNNPDWGKSYFDPLKLADEFLQNHTCYFSKMGMLAHY